MSGINTPFDRAFQGLGMPVPQAATSQPVATAPAPAGPPLSGQVVGRATGVPHYVPPPAPVEPTVVGSRRAGPNPITGKAWTPQPNPLSGLMPALATMFGGGAPAPAPAPAPADNPYQVKGWFGNYTPSTPTPAAIEAQRVLDMNSSGPVPGAGPVTDANAPPAPTLPQDPQANKIRFVDANTPRYAPPPGARPAGGADAGPAGGAAPPVTLQQARVLASFLQPRQQPLEAAQSELLNISTQRHNAALALAHATAGKNDDEIAHAKAVNDFLNGDDTNRHIEMLRSLVNSAVGTAVGTTHLGALDPSQ